jgi:hypothetical protein
MSVAEKYLKGSRGYAIFVALDERGATFALERIGPYIERGYGAASAAAVTERRGG